MKLTNLHAQNLMLSLWSVAGIFLFFSLLPGLIDKKNVVIIAPLVFITFGGADLFGTLITGYRHGPPHHIQWWAGWIEYSANTTSLFWVPQHAIPSWLGIALLMRQRLHPSLLPYLAPLFAAILLWSPFAAMGLMPFAVVLALQYGLRDIVLDWRSMCSLFFLAIPVASYLAAGTTTVPHGFIWTVPCTMDDGACFTWPAYFLFLVIEVATPLAILFLGIDSEKGFLLAAAISLCSIPLYKIGVTNDFAMRASIPAISVLSILSAKVLINGNRLTTVAILAMLVAALPTISGEVYRGFSPGPDIDEDTTFDAPWAERYIDQYFAPMPIWILRK
ncbi:hypothetical protein [Paraburkholderia saeva]|uniref:hypothetical protein n=1 Tax=Paraburkholderia saeva TaxID=2777537 RepID=UPI001E5A245E|nr:hypothetical protein [Paraburkholderia saeva]